MTDETEEMCTDLRRVHNELGPAAADLIASQAQRIEILDEEVDAFRSSEAYRRLERLCDELKEEIATLRAALEDKE